MVWELYHILKSKRKRKNGKAFLINQFSAKEHWIISKYKESEISFRQFWKPIIKNQIPQFVKKLKKSNLSDNAIQKSILL